MSLQDKMIEQNRKLILLLNKYDLVDKYLCSSNLQLQEYCKILHLDSSSKQQLMFIQSSYYKFQLDKGID